VLCVAFEGQLIKLQINTRPGMPHFDSYNTSYTLCGRCDFTVGGHHK